jgi:NAD(P)-dependent dehydrogenase (short-subunit alcohol dehydrogenase family)
MNYNAAVETARASEAVATNPGYEALAVEVDVCDMASVEAMVKTAIQTFGRIDYSVNSAGVGVQNPLPFEDADPAEMIRFLQVNVMGTFNCVQAVSKAMKKQSVRVISNRGREREVGRGVILNLGSANSYMATPNIVQYTTSKHAVLGLTKNAGKQSLPGSNSVQKCSDN